MASPTAPQKPPPPDVNIGTSLIIYNWTLAGVAAIVLGLRLFAVIQVLRRIRMADYAMVLAYICIIIAGGLITESYHWGLGRHSHYLSPDQKVQFRKYYDFAGGFMVASPMFGRISFCFFLLNTVGTRKVVQWLLYITIISQALVNLIGILLAYIGCGSRVARCVNPAVLIGYAYFFSVWGAFTDLFLTLIPVILLQKLQLYWKKKIIAMALLGLSAFAFIAATIKCFKLKELASPDFSWAVVKLNYWIMGEAYVVIIVASAPLMNSLVKWGKETMTSRGYGGHSKAERHQVSIKKTWTVEQVSSYEKPSDHSSTDDVPATSV